MTAHAATRGQWPISRFAPSPTGLLHLGHAVSAIAAHDLARAGGGKFLLRIEDIDSGRARPEFVAAIFADLRWLGLDWDGPVLIQSARGAHYAAALARLRALGLVYRCICTRSEIAASVSAPHGDLPRPYPGTCRRRPVRADDSRPGCWRIDMRCAMAAAPAADAAMAWGDIVVARKDALASYHLAVVVDDAAQGVTDVVRGADLSAATAVHRVLQAVLGLPTPRYYHHPLVHGPDGARLAKRTPGATLADLRDAGADPRALAEDLRAGRLPIGFSLATP